MSVKIIMTWDIAREHEQEYFEFVVREFIPGVQRLGLELSDAWATVYGDKPQIQVGATASTPAMANEVLESSEWKDLNNQLQNYVTSYTLKVVPAQTGFQF